MDIPDTLPAGQDAIQARSPPIPETGPRSYNGCCAAQVSRATIRQLWIKLGW